MARFIVPNHRHVRRMTFKAEHRPGLGVSVTIAVKGRVLELSDTIVEKYGADILEKCERGELLQSE